MKIPTLPVRLVALITAAGLASASAQNVFYTASLSGPNESPVNASPGTGFSTIVYNATTHILSLTVTFAGLIGSTTASHLHAATAVPFAGTAAVATTVPAFAGFPLGVKSGTYFTSLDLTQSSSWNPTFITANGGTTAGAEAALITAINQGRSYLNIHTDAFPGGEIRGFVVPAPDSGSTFALMLLGACGLALGARRLRRA
ncbi:MAG: CHRD domain-containing protein [Verrucomicrobiota bacterium]|nr:CHRD domain-containing protein [Verrucomicrobiota bacterium]